MLLVTELNGSFGSMPGSTSPGALKFAEYAEANGVNPSVYVGESYDAAALIVLAMASADCDISGCAGSDDSASIADNILSVANGPGVKYTPVSLLRVSDLQALVML